MLKKIKEAEAKAGEDGSQDDEQGGTPTPVTKAGGKKRKAATESGGTKGKKGKKSVAGEFRLFVTLFWKMYLLY